MEFRIQSIEDVAPGERTPAFGRYAVVIAADGMPHSFLDTVALPQGGGRSVGFIAHSAAPTVASSLSSHGATPKAILLHTSLPKAVRPI
jgi:hypothetical protein